MAEQSQLATLYQWVSNLVIYALWSRPKIRFSKYYGIVAVVVCVCSVAQIIYT